MADVTAREAIRNVEAQQALAVEEEEEPELEDRVVRIDRTRKTVKGGRLSSSRVVVAVGDGHGRVGLGVGKARNVPDAIAKALAQAKKKMVRIPMDDYTIPHEIQAKVGGAIILLKPASRGTGIIAGGATRQLIEVSGIRDILTKSLGSGNVLNRAKACFKALSELRDPKQAAAERGKSVEEVLGREVVDPYLTAEEQAEEESAAVHATSALLEEELDKEEVQEQ